MDTSQTESFVNAMWDDSIIPELCEYIKVPNKSPMFDPDWEKHGYMDDAVRMMETWCLEQPIKGMTTEVIKLEGRTPILECVKEAENRLLRSEQSKGYLAMDGLAEYGAHVRTLLFAIHAHAGGSRNIRFMIGDHLR